MENMAYIKIYEKCQSLPWIKMTLLAFQIFKYRLTH